MLQLSNALAESPLSPPRGLPGKAPDPGWLVADLGERPVPGTTHRKRTDGAFWPTLGFPPSVFLGRYQSAIPLGSPSGFVCPAHAGAHAVPPPAGCCVSRSARGAGRSRRSVLSNATAAVESNSSSNSQSAATDASTTRSVTSCGLHAAPPVSLPPTFLFPSKWPFVAGNAPPPPPVSPYLPLAPV